MAKKTKKQVKKISKKAKTVKSRKKIGKAQAARQLKPKKKASQKKKQVKKTASKSSSIKKRTSKATKQGKKKSIKKSKSNNPLLKPVNLSPELAAIMGGKNKLPRTEVIKKLWQYIKKHNLQDPKDKKSIHSDKKLKVIFQNRSSVNMFEMTKLISKHLS